jgi:hypothetical protein
MQIQAIPEKIWDQLSEPDREAMEMAFSALQAQELSNNSPKLDSGNGELATTCNDTISRQSALETVRTMHKRCDTGSVEDYRDLLVTCFKNLPSAQPEIIRCKECLMHCVCKFEQGLGLDGYCSQAKRRTDEGGTG